MIGLRQYAIVTAAYWAFTLTDGALRTDHAFLDDIAHNAAQALAGLATLVVQAVHQGPLAEAATVLLPASPHAEYDGTFVNFEGRAQRFEAAWHPRGEARLPLDSRLVRTATEAPVIVIAGRDKGLRRLRGATLALLMPKVSAARSSLQRFDSNVNLRINPKIGKIANTTPGKSKCGSSCRAV